MSSIALGLLAVSTLVAASVFRQNRQQLTRAQAILANDIVPETVTSVGPQGPKGA